jgi:radical SAM protein with 4Fe4S-binding SPASM domain
VRQLSDSGIPQVSLTGGEPLIRKDFLDIIDALLDHKITITQIYSNGLLVNDSLLSEFDKRGIKPEFSLSFDGVGCHDWLRGIVGAEKITVAAIRLLRSREFPVSIETSLHANNLHSLDATLDLLAELGVRSWKTSPTSDSGNWIKEGGKYNVTIRQLYDAYLDFIPKYKAAGAPLSIMLGGFFMCNKGSDKYRIPCKKFDGTEKMMRQTICPSARSTMYIGPDGRLLPCIPLAGLPLQEDLPSIVETELCNALSDSRYLSMIDTRLEDLLKVNGKCNACEHKLHCGGGCRAGAMLCGGAYLGCDEWTCYFFKNGYEEKIAALYTK